MEQVKNASKIPAADKKILSSAQKFYKVSRFIHFLGSAKTLSNNEN
jgi:hypothetical protein